MDTGPEFHEEHELRDGTRVTLRHVRPDDAAMIRRGLSRLSPESRFRRFLAPVTELTDAELRYLTCVDGTDHVAIGAVTQGPDGDEGLGIARFIRVPGAPEVAEAAITVVDAAQGKGLGYLLAITLARAAHERGVRWFRGRILADNAAVEQLLGEAGARMGEPVSGGRTFEVELAPTPFAPGTPLDVLARRFLRIASTALPGLFGRPHLPGE